MTKRIAVEQSLTNVTQALREKGYEVIDFKSAGDLNNCSACVVTGMDSNVMGMQELSTKAPIIEASGLSADEVCREIEERVQ
ncbi:YkuS family protein [Pseudobacillus badius]|uniref:YkuS family protein n=1 Tax=Bacillus badius TaxID=1455 RepID=UPI0007B09B61|nr:YkuS family protein [Bacillus badius]KZN99666.1 hypothetical protein A4244_16845 [Bacillus badius]MED0665804.1 YkuS family protein [Bacillus badius]OCS85771.1 hypothetical protein A6M11_16860 [Bacillus badius]OVE51872.1 hypothetical protein B1A98_09975 [Bacillus badius]TDW03301.1 uncharacterized protein UPF0180 [Bacillus badius]